MFYFYSFDHLNLPAPLYAINKLALNDYRHKYRYEFLLYG